MREILIGTARMGQSWSTAQSPSCVSEEVGTERVVDMLTATGWTMWWVRKGGEGGVGLPINPGNDLQKLNG